MNQGMLILLLVLLGGSNTYAPFAAGQDHQLVKAGAPRSGMISTKHLIRQMHEAINALQRVEQIGRLADFSTIHKKESRLQEEAHEDGHDSYIGNIRESFGNVADLLSGGGEDKEGKALAAYPPDAQKEQQDVGLGALSGLAGLLGGGGGSQDALLQTVGTLLSSMNTGGSSRPSGGHDGGESTGQTERGGRSGRGAGAGGLDIDKLTKMVNLISALNGAGKKS